MNCQSIEERSSHLKRILPSTQSALAEQQIHLIHQSDPPATDLQSYRETQSTIAAIQLEQRSLNSLKYYQAMFPTLPPQRRTDILEKAGKILANDQFRTAPACLTSYLGNRISQAKRQLRPVSPRQAKSSTPRRGKRTTETPTPTPTTKQQLVDLIPERYQTIFRQYGEEHIINMLAQLDFNLTGPTAEQYVLFRNRVPEVLEEYPEFPENSDDRLDLINLLFCLYQATQATQTVARLPTPVMAVKKTPKEVTKQADENDEEKGEKELDEISLDQLCQYYANNPLSPKRVKELNQEALDEVTKFLNKEMIGVQPGHLKKIFHVYDRLYFRGKIDKYLKDNNSTMDFALSSRLTATAGHCSRKGKCKYTMTLSTTIFNNLFRKGEKSHRTNGVHCYSRLECFLNVFEHELTHLVIMNFCDEIGQREGSHGKTFQKIVKSLFGHTDFRHSLTSGDSTAIGMSKDVMQEEGWEEASFRGNDGGIMTGKILKFNPRKAKIRVGEATYNVPYSNILQRQDDTQETEDDEE